jgi:hypothetical protein
MAHSSNFKELTGKTFGQLQVLRYAGTNTKSRASWLCLCACGTECIVEGWRLNSSHTQSCGCTARRRIDLVGKQFGRLTVVKQAGKDSFGQCIWECLCECGLSVEVRSNNLRRQLTTSCGCKLIDTMRGNTYASTHTHARHGNESPTYNSWHAMLTRTRKPIGDHKFYSGVTVDQRWDTKQGGSFEQFTSDIGERPAGTTLGRILDRGNYEPGNCFWMTWAEQGLQKRNNNALTKWQQEVA